MTTRMLPPRSVKPFSKRLPFAAVLCCRFFLPFFLFSSMASAEVYKWSDAGGHVHFSDRNSGNPNAAVVTIKVNSYEHVSYTTVFKPPVSHGKVLIYSANWCGYCKKAKAYFQGKGIAYQEYDIETSEQGKKEYDAMQGKGVPIILVGNKRMNGFSEEGFLNIYTGNTP